MKLNIGLKIFGTVLLFIAILTVCVGCSGTSSITADNGDDSQKEEPATTIVTTEEPTTMTTTEAIDAETIATVASESAEMVDGCIVADSGTPAVRAMEQYYYSEDAANAFAENVDAYADALGGNVKVYAMPIPTSQAFYCPESVKGDYPDQGQSIQDTCSKFTKAVGINIYDILNQNKNYYIYSRTDYHWQPLGAYFAAEKFAEMAEVPFADYNTYEKITKNGYLGAFYSVNNITALADYPDDFTYYKPANLDRCKFTYYDTTFQNGNEGNLFNDDISTSSLYTVFVGTDETILETDTDVNNNRVLVIFKDSYGNALIPFLTSSFSKIYLCDDRYFDINAKTFIEQVGATDVLFALGSASLNSSDKIDFIRQNLNK